MDAQTVGGTGGVPMGRRCLAKEGADSRYTTGSGGPCFTDEYIKEYGMTVTVFGRMACNPDKLTN